MKYGVNTMVWTTRVSNDQDGLFSRIRNWGFDGVELFLSPDEPADIAAVKRTLDHLDLDRTACGVLPRDAHLVSAQPEIGARGVDYLKRCVERAAELGACLVCGLL
jgi:D-psicose/D-tagatose/L-ribulose 3-epimerase